MEGECYYIESKGAVSDEFLLELLSARQGLEICRVDRPGLIYVRFAEGSDFSVELENKLQEHAHVHKIPYQRLSEKYL